MTELALLDATAQAELVRAGQVTAVELTEAAIERIEALNPELNAVVTPAYEQALEAARTVRGGPFAGVPYLLKDLACEMAGVRFTEGSRFLADNVSTFDAELVVRLRKADSNRRSRPREDSPRQEIQEAKASGRWCRSECERRARA